MALTLERLGLAEGMVLARTWRPTVRRQPALAVVVGPMFSGGGDGRTTKPIGRRGMQEGSSPLIASWIPLTSTLA